MNHSDVVLIKRKLQDAVVDQMYYGTVDVAQNPNCFYAIPEGTLPKSSYDGGLIGQSAEPAALLTKMAFKTFFNWAITTYPDAFN